MPEPLIDLFLQEVATEPHRNTLRCSACRHVYKTDAMEHATCTQGPCRGTIQRLWDRARAEAVLFDHLKNGELVAAWTLTESSAPVGLCVCEVHGPETVVGALDHPMEILQSIYPWAGRTGPYLVIRHLWIGATARGQQTPLIVDLVETAVNRTIKRLDIRRAPVLIPVDTHSTEVRHRAIKTWLPQLHQHQLIGRDQSGGRHRAVLTKMHTPS